LTKIIDLTAAEDGDLLFFGAGNYHDVSQYMGALRLKVGEDTGRVASEWRPLWVVDFPMFEWNADDKRWDALHHPFTAPACDLKALKAAPGEALSKAYDMVLNGVELGGGSIRIHQSDIQSAVFELLDITPEQANEKFGFLLDALDYGCPPMGGIAFGVDRMAALMCAEESIREVIAFPKTASGACPLTAAPSVIDDHQLADVHIQVVLPEADE